MGRAVADTGSQTRNGLRLVALRHEVGLNAEGALPAHA